MCCGPRRLNSYIFVVVGDFFQAPLYCPRFFMFGFSRRNGVAVLHFTAHRDDLMTEISPREKSFSLVSGPPSPSTYIYLIHTTRGQKKKKKNVKKKRQNKGLVVGKREGKQCLKNCMITSEESEGRQKKTAKKSAGGIEEIRRKTEKVQEQGKKKRCNQEGRKSDGRFRN